MRRDRYHEQLNWIRAMVLGANDGIVTITALSVGVTTARPSAALIVALLAMVSGASAMALGEYMSVSTMREAENDHHVALTANPWQAALASAVSFLCGGAIPAVAIIWSPQSYRLPVLVAAALAALTLTGIVGARLSAIPATRSIRRLLVGGMLAVALTYGLTRLADDPPNDDAFLSSLRSQGIAYTSPDSAIAAGHAVCTQLDAGQKPADVANVIIAATNLDAWHAGYFVGASIGAYCPSHGADISSK